MVDESLKDYLSRCLAEKAGMKKDDAKAGLDLLFTYTEKEHSFSDREVAALITAIDEVKILDPAIAIRSLVHARRDGNRLYYRANTSQPLFPDLCGIVLKTSSIAAELSRALAPVEGIDHALIFGSVASSTATSQSDVDLRVIGTTGLRKITPALRGVADVLAGKRNRRKPNRMGGCLRVPPGFCFGGWGRVLRFPWGVGRSQQHNQPMPFSAAPS